MAKDLGISRRVLILAVAMLATVWSLRLVLEGSFADNAKDLFSHLLSPTGSSSRLPNDAPTGDVAGDPSHLAPPTATSAHGRIGDKVAVITDTLYTQRLLPLILHFHAVLGPGWPIVFYTSQAFIDSHLQNSSISSSSSSSAWARAVNESRIDVRAIPARYDLTSRRTVNAYLGQSWLWEQLAPARHVLVFQADAMLCANAHRAVDSFLGWDFAGAWLAQHEYNGGLSLRNRTMMLDAISADGSWEEEVEAGRWDERLGEDVWFSRKFRARGARLPPMQESLEFAVEYAWQVDKSPQPMGYHKVHKNAPAHVGAIAEWCPEIMLASAGKLPR